MWSPRTTAPPVCVREGVAGKWSQRGQGNCSAGEETGNHGLEKAGILSLQKKKPSAMKHNHYLYKDEGLLSVRGLGKSRANRWKSEGHTV